MKGEVAVQSIPAYLNKKYSAQNRLETMLSLSKKGRLLSFLGCSLEEDIPVEAAYHFQFYFFLESALRNSGFSVLAEFHPWEEKEEKASRRHIDLYIDGIPCRVQQACFLRSLLDHSP
jgi:hypothetical protein